MKSRYRQPTETGPLVALEQGPYALAVAPGFGAPRRVAKVSSMPI